MFRPSLFAVLAVALSLQVSLGAQARPPRSTPTSEPPDPRQASPATPGSRTAPPEARWQSWLRPQVFFFQNFFWVPESLPEQDVFAAGGELGTSVLLSRARPVRAYVNLNYLEYDEPELEATGGLRVGIRGTGRPHSFDVYADEQRDRPTFDVGDEFDTADIRTLSAEYAYRFLDDWEVGLDGQFQEQEYEITTGRDNEFSAAGLSLRYRGWDISPEVGFQVGERDVDNEAESYDEQDWYLQLRSALTRTVYVSVRYRNRQREYPTTDRFASTFERKDDRQQLSGSLDWRFAKHFSWGVWASYDTADVTRTNEDDYTFDASLIMSNITIHF
jgi:hypothetical protein